MAPWTNRTHERYIDPRPNHPRKKIRPEIKKKWHENLIIFMGWVGLRLYDA